MKYSVFIELNIKKDIEDFSFDVQYYTYYNDNYNNNFYEDILENITNRYSSGHIESNFISTSIEENVYNAAKYLTEIPYTLILITSTSNSDLIADLFYKYIDEIVEEKKEKKLEKLFSKIEYFTKKYCTNNNKHEKEEWIEIDLSAQVISEINVNKIYKIPIEDTMKNSEYISVFYHKNSIGFVEATYENPNNCISKDNLILNSSLRFEDFDMLEENYYSIIFYKITDILNFFVSSFRNYTYFKEHTLELQKKNDLVIKIYKANKKFES